jgi:cell wall-associated NlpC family hydrolase
MRKFNIEISSVSKSQARTGKEIPLKRVKPGDLIFFGKGRKVTHVALVTKNTRDGIFVIHSTSSKGIMEQNVSKSSYWKPKILFARDVITR